MTANEAKQIDAILPYALEEYEKHKNEGKGGQATISTRQIIEKCFGGDKKPEEIQLLYNYIWRFQPYIVFSSDHKGRIMDNGLKINFTIGRFIQEGGMLAVFSKNIIKQNRNKQEQDLRIEESKLNVELNRKVIEDYPLTKKLAEDANQLANEANELAKDANKSIETSNNMAYGAIIISLFVLIFEIIKLFFDK